jgi:hypothetical protein
MTLKSSNIAENTDYRLSVQVSLTGLSFLVTTAETKDTEFFSEKRFDIARAPEELLVEIEDIINQTEALQPLFDSVTVIYVNNIYTTVPSPLFEESKASEYLKFNSKILANDYIAFDQLENYDITVVYVPYVNINNYFFERYGSFQYYHSASIFLKNVMSAEKHSEETKMYLHLQQEQFDCIVVNNGNLSLCNTYFYKTPEDFIYYVLFGMEQLGLNPDTTPVVLCGDIEKDDSNYKILYTYIRHISFTYNNEAMRSNIGSLDSHKNFILNSAI